MQLRREEEGDGGGARACVTFASVDRAARARKDPRPRNFAPIDRPTQSALPARMRGRGGIGQTGARFPVARCVRLTSPAHLGASRAHQTGGAPVRENCRTDGRARTHPFGQGTHALGGREAVSDFYCQIDLIFQMILYLK